MPTAPPPLSEAVTVKSQLSAPGPALQEIQTFTGGRLAGITAKLTVRPGEATYFDRKEKRKKTSSIWALSLEVEGDAMRELIANLTENARLFAETRKQLGSGGKVLEVVEGEQEQAPEVTTEFYPMSLNGSSVTEPASPTETTPGGALLKITPRQSFPRKRESSSFWTGLGPRLRGGDNNGDFDLLGWAAGPLIPRRTRQVSG